MEALISVRREVLAFAAPFAACVTMLFTGRAQAEDNTAVILNGTTTNFGGSIVVGNTGTNNSLQILNGGSATNTDAIVGNNPSASNNFVLVTDANSLWFNSGYVLVGYYGGRNQLIVTNGGRVDNNIGYVG